MPKRTKQELIALIQKQDPSRQYQDLVALTVPDLKDLVDTLFAHINDEGNPHNVTADQIGALRKSDLKPGDNIKLESDGRGWRISADIPPNKPIYVGGGGSGGTPTTADNVGAGAGVYKETVNSELQLRSIVAGSNKLTATENTNDITLDVAQANIDHDQLANFETTEHVDHSSVDITAGDGLSGGGDITASRTLAVDIANATSGTLATGDELLFADVDDGDAIKKCTAQDIADLAGGGAFAADGNFAAYQGTADAGAGSNIGSLAQGSNATASGNYGSFAQGQNVISGAYSGGFAQGKNVTTSGGQGNFAQGSAVTATGGYWGVFAQGSNVQTGVGHGCFAQGRHLVATGTAGCFVQGVTCTANAAGSWAVGQYATADKIGQSARQHARRSVNGDASANTMVLRRTTTDATETELSPTGSAPSGSSSRMSIASGMTWTFQALISARQYGGASGTVGDSWGYKLEGVIKNVSGTTSLQGSVLKTVFAEADANFDVSATADDTNDSLKITVTGAASKSVHWVASVHFVQVG